MGYESTKRYVQKYIFKSKTHMRGKIIGENLDNVQKHE